MVLNSEFPDSSQSRGRRSAGDQGCRNARAPSDVNAHAIGDIESFHLRLAAAHPDCVIGQNAVYIKNQDFDFFHPGLEIGSPFFSHAGE
jgi:hypothetical protein